MLYYSNPPPPPIVFSDKGCDRVLDVTRQCPLQLPRDMERAVLQEQDVKCRW